MNTRRALISRLLLPMLAPSLSLAPETVLAQGSGAGLARSVSWALAQGALGKVGGEAGSLLLGFIGMDSGNGQINAKLDRILNELQELKQAVDRLTSLLTRSMNQIAYSVSLRGVQELISANTSILGLCRDFANPRNDPDATLDAISQFFDRTYISGLTTWHNDLIGASGQQGILEAFSNVAARSQAPFFGPAEDSRKACAMIQRQWDYFDSHQALTAHFLYVYHITNNRQGTAQRIVSDWSRNRRIQLEQLRGCVRNIDQSYAVDPRERRVQSVTTRLNALPPSTLLLQSGQQVQMWYTNAGPARSQPAGPHNTASQISAAQQATGIAEWRLPRYEEFQLMVNAVGGPGRIGDGVDRFRSKMISIGFTGFEDSPQPVLWFNRGAAQRDSSGDLIRQAPRLSYFYTIATEGKNWWYGEHDGNPNLRGHHLLIRNLAADEAARYLYLS
jgi:hypothetical protein